MISFKEYCFLPEEWQLIDKGGIKGIWKNPTKLEYKDIPAGVRGVINKNGDLYVANEKIRYDNNSGFSDNHDKLSKQTAKAYPETALQFSQGMYSSAYKSGISLVRVGKTRLFKIGRDEWNAVKSTTNEDMSDPLHKKRIQLLKKANKKNPSFSFQYKPISDDDDRW